MFSERSIRRVIEQFQWQVDEPLGSRRHQDVQIVLDSSASMTSGDGSKEQCARELAVALLQLAEQSGRTGTVWALRGAERSRRFHAGESDRITQFPFDGTTNLKESWPADLEASTGTRILLSDFLFDVPPQAVIEQAGRGASKLFVVQLLDPWESDPREEGWTRLVDVESEQWSELELDSGTVDRYRRALAGLQKRYIESCAAAGAVWLSIPCSAALEQLCRDHLVPAGLLLPAEPSS